MKFITNDKILYFITLILLTIVSTFVYYIYIHNKGSNFLSASQVEEEERKNSNIVATVSNHVNVFAENDVRGVQINIPGEAAKYFNDQAGLQSDTYSTYTYQTFFRGDQFAKPKVRFVIKDLLAGLNYATTDSPTCLDRDQISVRYSNHVCNNNNRCLSESGNRFTDQNGAENFFQESPNIDYCTTSLLGSLSFNFKLNPISGYVDIETAFLNIDYIACGTCAYNDINIVGNSFFIDNDLFESTTLELDNDYIPILENKSFQTNNIKQTLKIERYTYNGENDFKSDPQGMVGEILYRPGNLYLTAEGTQTGITSIKNFSIPSSSQFDNPNLIRYIKQIQGSTTTGGLGAKCFVYNNTYKIIDSGQNYVDASGGGYITQIQDDNLEFVTFANADILTGYSYRFKFKPKDGTCLSESVNWMLIPPTDLSPGKITKNNLLKSGCIKSFSRSTEIATMKIISNIKTCDLPVYQNITAGDSYIPLPENSNVATITYSSGSENLLTDLTDTFKIWVENNISGSVKNLNITAVSYNNGIYDQYPPYIFNATQSGIPEDKDFLSQIKISGIFTDTLIQKAGLAVSSATTLPLPSVPSVPDDNKTDKTVNTIAKDAVKFNNVITGFMPGLGTPAQILATAAVFFPSNKKIPVETSSLDPMIVDPFDVDVVIDGSAVLTRTNPFLNILGFSSEYFNQHLLTNGDAATLISNILPGTVSFRTMDTGIIDTVLTNQVFYDGSCFASLNTAKYLVDVNNDNFSTDIGGSIQGTGGRLYITFSGPADVPYGYVQSVLVESGGSNYSAGNYTMNASAISSGLSGKVENLLFTVTTESDLLGLKYEAVPQDTNGAPYNIANTSKGNKKNYGLIIGVSGTQTNIENGGDGYISGDKIYINQLDNNLNSLIGPSFDPERITEENMQKLPYVYVNAPNVDEVSKGTSLDPAHRNLILNTDNNIAVEYNFWEDSPGIYTPCPQQIALMDKTQREYFNNQGICINRGIKDLLLNDTVEGITTIQNIKTIQFQELNYRSDGTSANINGQSYLEIGRFIPYQDMRPPTFSGTENIPTAKGDYVWVNYNYCQFIPYGVENLYQKRFSNNTDITSSVAGSNFYKNLPTF